LQPPRCEEISETLFVPPLVAKRTQARRQTLRMAQTKYTRHGFEMGVFSEQLEIPGFKTMKPAIN
jgi:hypothetical protein